MASGDRNKAVFINCPFDSAYKPIFDAVVFAIFDSGFIARSALELVDSAENRFERISKIIADCNLAVHDISRTELDARTGLPRFNMPFELGLYLGARRFGGGSHRRKNCLVLDRKKFRYQKFLSDISGQDISEHGNSPRRAVFCVRNWLSSVSGSDDVPGAVHIWSRYKAFEHDLPIVARELKLSRQDMQFGDLRNVIVRWLRKFAT